MNWITIWVFEPCHARPVMWPFRRKTRSRDDDASATIDAAILFTAQRWCAFSRSVALPAEMTLRDRISIFARALDESLHGHFPTLVSAPEQVILLIIAKGVEQSGLLARGEIERELGIILPH
ncbi:hypothetical protein GG804_01035 [Sphingomonas histidinilytica]|nr:hypothetical protein [Rhizorhabdus histidinilytica]